MGLCNKHTHTCIYTETRTGTDTHIDMHTSTHSHIRKHTPSHMDEGSTNRQKSYDKQSSTFFFLLLTRWAFNRSGLICISNLCCDWLLFSEVQWCEANVEIYRWLFLGSMYMGTTLCQQGVAWSHPKIWSNAVKTSLRWQEETESNLFPMGQKHLLFLLLTKHISVCLAAISTPALISTDQWPCI